ncbi:MAG: UDP-N-acetylmuramoyl-tripeptide--D-alanyl-D-alanine ligase [Candidatus Cloacimonetes bacterium]|nr:UDP-N-acetylmuramoyl-tripeptide--D-alanyl-D-alanine ligase [Candidatus Cloacimonadota bacterium]
MKELSIKEIISAINGKTTNEKCISINKVFTDSRKICEEGIKEINSIFFALKGENYEGHNFVFEALNNGAQIAVVEYIPADIKDDKKLIYVDNTLIALGKLAKYYKEQFELPIIGITGSVGKTLTKEFVANVLSQKYKVHKTKGNLNTLVGLPLTVFEMSDSHEISVLELGTSEFGEMKRLTQICKPNIAVITSIGESHLEFLQDLEGVFKEKFDIFKYSLKNSLKIFNSDIKFLRKYKGCKHYISYGLGKSDFELSSIFLEHGKYSFKLNKDKYFIYNNGRHNIFNAIPAIIIGKEFGLNRNEIQKGLLDKSEVKLRMEIIHNKINDWLIIADCYNANPVSMRAALVYLNNTTYKYKYAILGDMLELGEKRVDFHKEIGQFLKNIKLDKTISIGDLSKNFNSSNHYRSTNEFIDNGIKNIPFPKQSAILVKGSRALEMEKIVERLVG